MGNGAAGGTGEVGATPPCVICGRGGRGRRTRHHLTHGVSVWLCPAHAAPTFMRRRGGTTFTERLGAAWVAAGATTARRSAALDAHLRRVRSATPARHRPGSYAWPAARREAERRFAAGEPPARVIADIRHRCGRGAATAPSVRTMRRWFAEARWTTPAPPPAQPRPPRPRQERRGRVRRHLPPTLPPGFNRYPFWPYDRWWSGGG
jgi:hypothetical protein